MGECKLLRFSSCPVSQTFLSTSTSRRSASHGAVSKACRRVKLHRRTYWHTYYISLSKTNTLRVFVVEVVGKFRRVCNVAALSVRLMQLLTRSASFPSRPWRRDGVRWRRSTTCFDRDIRCSQLEGVPPACCEWWSVFLSFNRCDASNYCICLAAHGGQVWT